MLPKRAEYVKLCYDSKNDKYYANALDYWFSLSPQQYALLQAADGKTNLAKAFPEYSTRQLAYHIRRLKQNELLITSRMQGVLVGRLSLFRIANRVKPIEGFCGIANLLLPLISVLVFSVGIFCYRDFLTCDGTINIPLCFAFFLLSVIAHEFGHFVAGVSYRYYVIDTGILLALCFFPIGAYISFARDNLMRKKRHKVQFHLAGIEVNLLLAGVFSLLSATALPNAGDFSLAALMNTALAGMNAIPAPGLDGGDAFGAIFGVDCYSLFVCESLKGHRRLLHSGAAGRLCLAVALVGAISIAVHYGIIISATVNLVKNVAILISF